MTEDTSPENLRKFLESDDPAIVQMGLSMAKGGKISDDLLALICGLYMWHDDSTIRSASKSIFMKHAPEDLKTLLKGSWQTSYRTIKRSSHIINISEKIISDFKETPLDSFDLWRCCFVEPTCGPPIEILEKVGSTAVKPLAQMLDKNIKEEQWFFGKTQTICKTLNSIGGFEAINVLLKLVDSDTSFSLKVKSVLTTVSLRTALEEKSLPLSGTREQLIQRLIDYRNNSKTEEIAEKSLEKLLKSENLAMIQKGLEMAKNEFSDDLLPIIVRLYMWNDDRSVRTRAKSIFIKFASNELKTIMKINWKTSYRTLLITGDKFSEAIYPLLEAFKLEDDLAKVVLHPLIKANKTGSPDAATSLGKIGDKRAVGPLIKSIGAWRNRLLHNAAVVKALGQIGDVRAVKPLIIVLDEEDVLIRRYVSEALGKIGDSLAVEPLVKLLGDQDSDVRVSAVKALGKIGDKRAVEPLIMSLQDSEYVSRTVAGVLNKLGWVPETDEQRAAYLIAAEDWESLIEWGEAAVEPLIGMLSNDGWVREPIIYGLGEIGNAGAVEVLIEVLGDEDVRIRIKTAEALGKIGDSLAVEPLVELIGDPNRYVRENTVEALGKIGDKRSVEPLIGMLSNRPVSRSAIEALGKIGDKRSVEPLLVVLSMHPQNTTIMDDRWTHDAAKKALEKLGHKVDE
jgi:HEAT repeat protein